MKTMAIVAVLLALAGCGGEDDNASAAEVDAAREAIFAHLASGQPHRAADDARLYVEAVRTAGLSDANAVTELATTFGDLVHKCLVCTRPIEVEIERLTGEDL